MDRTLLLGDNRSFGTGFGLGLGQPFHNPVGEGLPTIHPGIVSGVGIRLLTNPDLSSHAINQFLGIVADPGLEHRLDVLNLVNAL